MITAEGFVIFAGVDAFQISAGDAQGPMHLVGLNDSLLQQELMQQSELRHRKAMGARQRRGVMRVVNDRKRQGVVSPGMAQAIQGSGRLLVQQPVVEATGVQFADAALQFAQMALLDLGESLSFLGCWPDADSLLIESVHLAVEMFHQVEHCLLYTSPSPRDATLSRMPSSA